MGEEAAAAAAAAASGRAVGRAAGRAASVPKITANLTDMAVVLRCEAKTGCAIKVANLSYASLCISLLHNLCILVHIPYASLMHILHAYPSCISLVHIPYASASRSRWRTSRP